MRSSTHVVVATHGHCFDGMASAVLFTRLYQSLQGDHADIRFQYHACDYRVGDSAVPSSWLDGSDNAILDFRYTATDALTWYFDHHGTAFRTPQERDHFQTHARANHFYDPTYSSCAKLIADVAKNSFGIAMPELEELIAWADRIDSARFASAEQAIVRTDPELQLMTVLEHCGDDALLSAIIPQLLTKTLHEVSSSEYVQTRYAPLQAKRITALERMRACSARHDHIAVCELTNEPSEVVEKFALYAIYPSVTYSVVLAQFSSKIKITIGYNPWSSSPRTHHIGTICERYGGGGHPVVGAFALPAHELTKARDLVASIVAELAR